MIRGPRKTDQGYVASTWVRSMSGCANRPLGEKGGALGRLVDQVLERDDTRALIRHAAGDQDRILGYVVHCEGPGVPTVHYVYVRDSYREQGIATELLTAIGAQKTKALVFTCRGPSTRRLVTAYPASTFMPLEQFLKPGSP